MNSMMFMSIFLKDFKVERAMACKISHIMLLTFKDKLFVNEVFVTEDQYNYNISFKIDSIDNKLS